MTSVVTVTCFGDYHAYVVEEVLRERGIDHRLWLASDFPRDLKISAHYPSDSSLDKFKIVAASETFDLDDVKVVWNRRPNVGNIFDDDLHPGDRAFVADETRHFLRTLWLTSARTALWANDPVAKLQADSKAWQILKARAVGLATPETLMSNNFDDVVAFAQGRKVIYKSFHGRTWKIAGETLNDTTWVSNFTTKINGKELDRDAVESAPGIYQVLVPKAFELRIILCGGTLLPVKIDSQSHDATVLDFRPGQMVLPLEEYQLPGEIEEKILALARAMGIVFGSFDFIVTPEGEHVFLEVNEQGQFLWIEANNPKIHVTQLVADFLISGDPEFLWKRPDRPVLLDDIETRHAIGERYKADMLQRKFRDLHIQHGVG